MRPRPTSITRPRRGTDMTNTDPISAKTGTPTPPHGISRVVRRVGDASARRPWTTVAAWSVVTALVVALTAAFGGAFLDNFTAPHSESARATKLLHEQFPEASGGSAVAVFAAPDGRQ